MHMQEHYQHIFSRKDVDGQSVIDEAKLKNFAGIIFYVRRDSFTCVTALMDWFWLPIFRTNLVCGLSKKEKKIQNKGAVPVQIAPLLISQPCNQNQSILTTLKSILCRWAKCCWWSETDEFCWYSVTWLIHMCDGTHSYYSQVHEVHVILMIKVSLMKRNR